MKGGPLRRALGIAWVLIPSMSLAAVKTTAVPFLTFDVSARAAGMGGAQAAIVNDATALVANPAALRRIVRPSAVLMHAESLESSSHDFAGFGRRVGRAGAWGIGAQYFSAGSVDRVDIAGNQTGSFEPNDLAAGMGYAQEFGYFYLGAGAKYIRSKLADTASTGAVDLGLITTPRVHPRLRFALALSNLGGKITYTSEPQSLPTQTRVGCSYTVSSHWGMAADVVLPLDGRAYMALGAEVHLPSEGAWDVAFRAGYSNRSDALEGWSGLAGGLGVAHENIGVDYALVSQGEEGFGHRISLSFRIGPVTKPPVPKQFPRRLPL